MISPILLSDSLANRVASEVVCARLRDAVIGHVTNEIAENVSKELLDISLAHIAEMKRSLMFEKLFKSLVPYEKKLVAMLHSIWETERKIIIANIKKMRKAYLKKDAIDQLLYPKSTLEKKLSAQAAQIILVILDEKGTQEMGTIAAADVVFDVSNPEVQKWLTNYTPKFSARLEEVNVIKLRKELIEGINAGEGVPELIKRVNLTYDNWYKVRSEAIAQNQALRASNRANLFAYKQSGVVKKKIWIANLATACHWCAPLDGKIVELEQPFFDMGDEYTVKVDGKAQTMKLDYEVVESAPLHNRCVCTVSAWIEE